MGPIGRRRLLAGVAVAAGTVVISRSVVELLPSGQQSTAALDRLGARSTEISAALRDLGRRVNEQSPDSIRRVNELAAARPDGPMVPIIVAASRAEPHRAPVIVDGWLLPDPVAGIAGAAALEHER
jgi:hypothetical protein